MNDGEKTRGELSRAKRIVVKVGTTCVTDENSKLDLTKIEKLASNIDEVLKNDREVILVSSGAIGAGLGKLPLDERPEDMSSLQAASTIGQGALMEAYSQSFNEHGQNVAQILLTQEDFTDPIRYQNFENTLDVLSDWGVIPIINENDAVAVEEIRMGDNDLLSAFTATGSGADLLVLLSDVDGLHTEDPNKNESAKPIRIVEEITPEIESIVEESSDRDFGGIVTKVQAAKIVTREGIPVVVADGHKENVLKRILDGEEIGTLFLPNKSQEGELR